MDLLIGNIISRFKVTPIPITQEVINTVEAISKKYDIKYPLKFKYRKQETISEEDDETMTTLVKL